MSSYADIIKGTEDEPRATTGWSTLRGTLGELLRPYQDTEKLNGGRP